MLLKKIFPMIVIIITLIGCTNPGAGQDTLNEDMIDLMAAAQGLDVALDLVEATDTSRSIDPQGYDELFNDLNSDGIFNGSDTAMTPQEVFEDYQVAGETEVRVPATGYIEDFYSMPGNEAYFLISDDGAGRYRVKLYIYPRTNFSIEYEYEEYLVAAGSTAWTTLDATGAEGYIALETKYFDGATEIRSLENSHSGTVYSAFALPAIVDNTSAYTFTGSLDDINEPTPDTSGSYASYVYSTIDYKQLNLTKKEFYTEAPNEDERSSIAYITKNRGNGGIAEKVVQRYNEVYSNGDFESKTVKTVSSLGYNDRNWQYDSEEESLTLTGDNKIYYTRENKIWWRSEITGDPGRHSFLEVTETAVDSNQYSGTMELYWHNWTEDYMVTMADDNLKITHNGGHSRQAVRTIDEEISIPLNGVGSAELTINLPSGGRFTGSFVQGAFDGTYTSGNGQSYDADISSNFAILDGEDWVDPDME